MKDVLKKVIFGRKEKHWWMNILVPLISILLSFILGAILIKATGRDPVVAYKLLFGASGLFPGPYWKGHFAEMLLSSAMFIATGLGFAVAAKGGLFNIGAEGHFIVGGITAAYIGYTEPFASLPKIIHLPFIFILAMLMGGLWAAIAGYLKAKKGIHEVISTIMLNWIALYLIEGWLVIGPMKAAVETGVSGTPYISQTAKLPKILSGTRLNISIIIIIVVLYLVWYLFYKTTLGYEIRAMGHTLIFGMEAPKASGINVERRTIQTMFISGAIAALGGVFMVLGILFQYPPIFEGGYGFDGIAVALIGQNEPIGVLLAGILIGIEGFAVAFIALQALVRYWLIKLIQLKKSTQVKTKGDTR